MSPVGPWFEYGSAGFWVGLSFDQVRLSFSELEEYSPSGNFRFCLVMNLGSFSVYLCLFRCY